MSTTFKENNFSLYSSYIIASILNKIQDDTEFERLANKINEEVALKVKENIQNRAMHVSLLAWATKAVTLKGKYIWSDQWTAILCSLLSDEDTKIANEAANAFHVIIGDHPNILHKETHAIVQVTRHFMKKY